MSPSPELPHWYHPIPVILSYELPLFSLCLSRNAPGPSHLPGMWSALGVWFILFLDRLWILFFQRREMEAKQAIQKIFFGECVGGQGRSEGRMWGGVRENCEPLHLSNVSVSSLCSMENHQNDLNALLA